MQATRISLVLAALTPMTGCTGGVVTDIVTEQGINNIGVVYSKFPEVESIGWGGAMLTQSMTAHAGDSSWVAPGIYSNFVYGEITSPFLGEGTHRALVGGDGYLSQLFYVDHRADDTCPYLGLTGEILGWEACERQDFALHPLQSNAVYDLLPDLIPDPRGLTGYYDVDESYNGPYTQCVEVLGDPVVKKVLRASVTVANVGSGPLELDEGFFTAQQRIHRRNALPRVVDIPGAFEPHPEHSHIHFQDYVHMRLATPSAACDYWKSRSPDCVLGAGEKISFCVMESSDFYEAWAFPDGPPGSDDTWPLDFTNGSVCFSTHQGMRPGKADTYVASLSGQMLDLDGIPNGTYWLEVEVDPTHQFAERSTENNTLRMEVEIDGVCDSTLVCDPSLEYGPTDACRDFVD